MDTKKRFLDNFIWENNFFLMLEPKEKLFYIYINNKCDNIGYWEPNFMLAEFFIGKLDVKVFLERVNADKERIRILDNEDWFIINFVRFQFARRKPLNPSNLAHKSYIDLMHERNMYEWFKENQPEVLPSSEDKKKGL